MQIHCHLFTSCSEISLRLTNMDLLLIELKLLRRLYLVDQLEAMTTKARPQANTVRTSKGENKDPTKCK